VEHDGSSSEVVSGLPVHADATAKVQGKKSRMCPLTSYLPPLTNSGG
jgi:hypothetical protein